MEVVPTVTITVTTNEHYAQSFLKYVTTKPERPLISVATT